MSFRDLTLPPDAFDEIVWVEERYLTDQTSRLTSSAIAWLGAMRRLPGFCSGPTGLCETEDGACRWCGSLESAK